MKRVFTIMALALVLSGCSTFYHGGEVRINVLGAVNSPARIGLASNEATLLSAIASAGGTSDVANKRSIRLRRTSGKEVTVTTYDLEEILSGQQSDVPLQNGDTVEVGERRF